MRGLASPHPILDAMSWARGGGSTCCRLWQWYVLCWLLVVTHRNHYWTPERRNELHRIQQEGTLLEVDHAKAHRSKASKKCGSSMFFSRQALQGRTSWQKMEWRWRRSGPAHSPANREKVYAAMQYAASLHRVLWRWHDCEERKTSPQDAPTLRLRVNSNDFGHFGN